MFAGFVFIIIISSCVSGSDAKKSPLRLLGFLPFSGEGWIGGAACLPAVTMAINDISEYNGLLDDYNLTYYWIDTQVCSFSLCLL